MKQVSDRGTLLVNLIDFPPFHRADDICEFPLLAGKPYGSTLKVKDLLSIEHTLFFGWKNRTNFIISKTHIIPLI